MGYVLDQVVPFPYSMWIHNPLQLCALVESRLQSNPGGINLERGRHRRLVCGTVASQALVKKVYPGSDFSKKSQLTSKIDPVSLSEKCSLVV